MQILRAISRVPRFLSEGLRSGHHQSTTPRMLTYTVTFRCNAQCIMCDSWKMSGAGDLTIDEVEKIFGQLPKLDAVRLTGGEPFVRTDLPQILDLAVKFMKPLGVHITTNGFLTDRIVRLCETRSLSTPLQLMVSLDGVGEKHNHIRGSSIAWKTAIETLRQLAPHRKKLNLDLAVNQTIVDREGVEEYRKLRDVLKPLGIRHQAVMAYDQSATYKVERSVDVAPRQVGQFNTFGEFTKDDLESLVREIDADLKGLPWWARAAKKYYWDGIRERLDASDTSKGWLNPKCVALHSHLRIFPNGDIPTCQFNSKTIGNLRESSFASLWSNEKSDQQREWVRKCVGCWAECEVLPSAIYTLDLVRPSRQLQTSAGSNDPVRAERELDLHQTTESR